MSINGKIALVTGADKGIRRGIALRLVKDGAYIALVDLNEEKMNAVADEVKALGRKASSGITICAVPILSTQLNSAD